MKKYWEVEIERESEGVLLISDSEKKNHTCGQWTRSRATGSKVRISDTMTIVFSSYFET